MTNCSFYMVKLATKQTQLGVFVQLKISVHSNGIFTATWDILTERNNMLHVHSYGRPTRGEAEAIPVIKNELRSWNDYLLLTNYKLEGRTKETDAVLITPGLIMCLEFKDWHSNIEIPPDSSDWRVTPPVKPPNPTVANPLQQSMIAQSSLSQYLVEGTGFDRTKWRFSYAVVLTSLNKNVYFQGNNEDVRRKVFFIESFVEDIRNHMKKFHEGLQTRQSIIFRRDLEFLLARLNVPLDLSERYINHLYPPSIVRQPPQQHQLPSSSPTLRSNNQFDARSSPSASLSSQQARTISEDVHRKALDRYTNHYLTIFKHKLRGADTTEKRRIVLEEARIRFLMNIKVDNPNVTFEEVEDCLYELQEQMILIRNELPLGDAQASARASGVLGSSTGRAAEPPRTA